MATNSSKPKLIVIVGPTASGKSDLAVKIAQQFKGEIIAADSRTIYKGLDIGTAKPSKRDQKKIPHWGIDLVEPGQIFTAADFKRYALEAIKDIQGRGKLPILVGGTGLYIDSVIYDYRFGPHANNDRRKELESLSITDLQQIIRKSGLVMPANSLNKRHLVRVIEMGEYQPTKRPEPIKGSLIVGLLPASEILRARIGERADKMFNNGVIEEAAWLARNHPDFPAESAGLVYKLCSSILQSDLTREQEIEKFKTLDWQYARRQRTWFKRNKNIKWFETTQAAEKYIKSVLNT